jgi:hypothetical protein
MGTIADWAWLNYNMGTSGTPTNLYPTYSEVIATGKINVSGSYRSNQLVNREDCSKKQALINNFISGNAGFAGGGGSTPCWYNCYVQCPYSTTSDVLVEGEIVEADSGRAISTFSTYIASGSWQSYLGQYQERVPGNGVDIYIYRVEPYSDSTYRYT